MALKKTVQIFKDKWYRMDFCMCLGQMFAPFAYVTTMNRCGAKPYFAPVPLINVKNLSLVLNAASLRVLMTQKTNLDQMVQASGNLAVKCHSSCSLHSLLSQIDTFFIISSNSGECLKNTANTCVRFVLTKNFFSFPLYWR